MRHIGSPGMMLLFTLDFGWLMELKIIKRTENTQLLFFWDHFLCLSCVRLNDLLDPLVQKRSCSSLKTLNWSSSGRTDTMALEITASSYEWMTADINYELWTTSLKLQKCIYLLQYNKCTALYCTVAMFFWGFQLSAKMYFVSQFFSSLTFSSLSVESIF